MPLDISPGIEVKKFAPSLSDHPSPESRKIKVIAAMTRRSSAAQQHYFNGSSTSNATFLNKASPVTGLYGTAPAHVLRHRSPVLVEALDGYNKAAAVRLLLQPPYGAPENGTEVAPEGPSIIDDDEDKENEALYETDGNILIMSAAPALETGVIDAIKIQGEKVQPQRSPHSRPVKGAKDHNEPAGGDGLETEPQKGQSAEGDVLDKVTYLLTLHPKYFDTFYRAHIFMLKGNGPLKISDRFYIAMIAASRFHCPYLVDYQKREFLAQGGNPDYIKSLDHVPPKLRDLQEINKLLAHQPWLINKSHIEKLTKGSNNWSLSELIFAIAVMTHFHSLCSLVYGCAWFYGFREKTPEREVCQADSKAPIPRSDTLPATNYAKSKPGPNVVSQETLTAPKKERIELEGTVDSLVVKMKKLHQQLKHELETSHEEMLQRYENVVQQDNHSQHINGSPSTQSSRRPVSSPLIEDPTFIYEDFAKRDTPNRASTFRIQDYSWDHGFSLVSRLCSDLGPLLDDKFRAAYNLTYLTMGKVQGIDTSMFRRAIWNYIHCMFGIRHDDYDYSEVNHLLGREFKTFVKTLTCYPEKIYTLDNQKFMKDFKESEKVHVNLMIMEAKIQAQMLYALRAIMQYMT